MRYVTFSTEDDGAPRLGVAHADRVVDLRAVATGSTTLPASLVELIRIGPAVWRDVAEVFCVGRNFLGHAEEAARARGSKVKVPEVPMFFTKAPTSVIGPYDGSCPIGPHVVTADQFGDPHAKEITLRLNGVIKQRGNTGDMIFRIHALIESLSHALTLEPGDILATGTPEGVGFARTPPEFMQHGDIMETEIEGIGTMRNRIVAQ